MILSHFTKPPNVCVHMEIYFFSFPKPHCDTFISHHHLINKAGNESSEKFDIKLTVGHKE